MQVTHLSIEKLYGFMNKDISFNNRISILVGINGSGKTSVLNLINWLLTLNFEELCLIEFLNIKLVFKYLGDEYELTCKQHSVEITIDLENLTTPKKFPQIQATFKVHPKKLTKNKSLRDSTRAQYKRLGPEEHEIETWTFIVNTLPSPTVIGLDRNFYTQEGNELLVDEDYKIFDKVRIRDSAKKLTPIDKVRAELVKNYNIYKDNVLKFYSTINRKIVLSAFDEIITDENLSKILNSSRPTVKEIEVLQRQVKEFLRENKIIRNGKSFKSTENNEITKVDEYFSNLKNILKATGTESKGTDLLYIMNFTQFKKINDLVIEFKKYEEVTIRLYRPLQEFLSIINRFYRDSSKELYFEKSTSQIFFNILNKTGKIVDAGRDIENLSSGEKQVLIFLNYL
jgi:energy-coupling factor transporter ATP-binding protein EcfA2